jgi:hypothetical protein
MDCQGKTTVIGEGSNGKRRNVSEGVEENATAFTRTKSEDGRGSGGAGGACSAGLSVLASAGWSGFGPPTCPVKGQRDGGGGPSLGLGWRNKGRWFAHRAPLGTGPVAWLSDTFRQRRVSHSASMRSTQQ